MINEIVLGVSRTKEKEGGKKMSVRANFRIHTETTTQQSSKGTITRKSKGRSALSQVERAKTNIKDVPLGQIQKPEGTMKPPVMKDLKKPSDGSTRSSSKQKNPAERTATILTPNLNGPVEPRRCKGCHGHDEFAAFEDDIPDRGISMLMDIPEKVFMGEFIQEPELDFVIPELLSDSECDDLSAASYQSIWNLF